MQGDKENVGIVPIDILGAVAVMAVGVNNGNLFVTVVFPDKFYQNSFIVDVAEAPVTVDHLHGVVAGGTDQGKGFVNLLFHH